MQSHGNETPEWEGSSRGPGANPVLSSCPKTSPITFTVTAEAYYSVNHLKRLCSIGNVSSSPEGGGTWDEFYMLNAGISLKSNGWWLLLGTNRDVRTVAFNCTYVSVVQNACGSPNISIVLDLVSRPPSTLKKGVLYPFNGERNGVVEKWMTSLILPSEMLAVSFLERNSASAFLTRRGCA